jgi:DNA polymerase (family 10)
MPTREQIAEIFEKIALLLDLQDENPFKIRAYKTGAEVVESFPGDLLKIAASDDYKELSKTKGIGKALTDKLHELATTGKLEYYENLKAEFPATIFDLFRIQGLGPKRIKDLYKKLGIASIADLKTACDDDRIAQLPGFGKKTQAKILEAIAFREHNADRFRLGNVAVPAEQILEALKSHPDCLRAEVAGSYRRGKETLHDLDFLVATKNPQAVMDHFIALPQVSSVINHGKTKSSVRLEEGVQCDLRAVSNEEFPCALVYFTGSKEHNVALRGLARDQGYTLNEYRLAPLDPEATDQPPEIHDEADLYAALGLDFPPPELRENQGEIEAAAGRSLPRLIELQNLRGTFHNHTTASDGHSSLQEMAAAAIGLGLQYLGIADHSKASVQANGLNEKRLLIQVHEIHRLNREYEDEAIDFRLLAGTEVDILRDGSLDFDNDLLAQLDYAVASVHNAFTLPEAEMTKRIIAAIENPYVTMVGHLTGRLLLEREPYAVNIPDIIAACADTGTIIELNCNPWRLDMDWRWWKLAAEKGVKCAINPDAHRASDLDSLFYGIKIARKGWLTREDVVNCLPLDEIQAALNHKRERNS